MKTLTLLITSLILSINTFVNAGNASSTTPLFGPTGIYGTMDKKSQSIKITSVDKGSPADGKLEPGAEIIGVAGVKFKNHLRRELADAIDIAETKASRGKLALMLKGGKEVNITLKVLGTYSDTAPFKCKKSAAILKRATIGGGVLSFSELATMASKDAKRSSSRKSSPRVRKLIKTKEEWKMGNTGRNSYYVWKEGYNLIVYCEQYLLKPSKKLFETIRATALNFSAGQNAAGLYGHKLVIPETGRLQGYGAMNQPSLTVFIGMLLAKKCGVKDPLLLKAIERSYAYYATFIGKGTFKYGVHGPDNGKFTNNGMSATAAIAMELYGDKKGASFFSQLSAASHRELENGHASNFFNRFWTPLGVAVAGPEVTSEFFKKSSWLYTMQRRWDGKFENNGPRSRQFDGSSLVMFYALAKRSLVITGKDSDKSLWLKEKSARDAVSLGDLNYRTLSTTELLSMVSHPLPQIRRGAGWVLRDRKKEVLKKIKKLMANGNKWEKIFALGYFGYPQPPQTGRRYMSKMRTIFINTKEDPWVRLAAGEALSAIGKPAHKYYMDFVKMIAEERPWDTAGEINYALGTILTRISKTPLAAGIVKNKNKKAFYAAVLKLMKNKRSQIRTAGARMLVGMPLKDFKKVGNELMFALKDEDSDYHSYGPGPAGAAIEVFASLNIKEGLDYTRKIENTPNSKAGGILRTIWPIWSMYGASAKAELERFDKKNKNRKNWGRLTRIYNRMVKAVKEDKKPRPLITLEQALKAR